MYQYFDTLEFWSSHWCNIVTMYNAEVMQPNVILQEAHGPYHSPVQHFITVITVTSLSKTTTLITYSNLVKNVITNSCLYSIFILFPFKRQTAKSNVLSHLYEGLRSQVHLRMFSAKFCLNWHNCSSYGTLIYRVCLSHFFLIWQINEITS